MNKADMYMKVSIENILNEGYKDENPRPHYEDIVAIGDWYASKDGREIYICAGSKAGPVVRTISLSENQWHKKGEYGECIICTPAHTYSVNHVLHKYDISKGEFPITTLRPIYVKKAIGEILWIYQDESNDLNLLRDKYKVNWWDSWDIGNRTIGSCYGETVRRHKLMENLLSGIEKDPYGRRHIMNLWQENDFEEPHGLKPCCYQTQFLVRGEYLDMVLYQRSSDWLTAGNINQMQYVALMMMVARHCGYKPGVFSHFIANQQIYDRHVEQAKEMLKRTPSKKQPVLILNPDKNDFWHFTVDDFTLKDYEPVKPQLNFQLGI